jgi:translation initiation factor 3 subunit F
MSGETLFMHLVRPNVAAPAASSANGPAIIKIHTPALFQILEIVSKQVLSESSRIIGTLVGIRSDDGNEFEIKDAFMVPCDDTGDSIVIDDSVHKAFYQLYKKAHPKESVLGWFGSDNKIDSTTGLIHDFYSKGSDRAFPFPAIYLNVDFLTKDKQITAPTISTYIGASIGKPVSSQPQQIGWKTVTPNNSYIFTPIPNKIINATATERLTFNMLQQKSINVNTLTLNSDLSYLSQQLQAVTANIDNLLATIDTKSNGDKDLELLRLLSNNLLNKPKILSDLPALQQLFADHNQDVVMIEFLTKAVKEQVELSARLTASAEADKRQ